MDKIAKAYAISDAKITYVSLVKKAANKHCFIIAKSESNPEDAEFTSYGRILKADSDKHYVTGIVYEPDASDTDGNYMTEDEIIKAAHWYVKNNGKIDQQHSFEKADGVEMVETWVTKSDCEIEGQPIKKGTWLMTVEVTDEDTWKAIQKGDITGFSMGGKGKYSTVDDNIAKGEADDGEPPKKQGVVSKIASFFNGAITKGAVMDEYNRQIKSQRFWTAFDVLRTTLGKYSDFQGRFVFEADEATIRESLEDFSEIIIDILTQDDVKSVIESRSPKITKSIKKEENDDMTRDDIVSIVKDVLKAEKDGTGATTPEVTPAASEATPAEHSEGVTAGEVTKMVQDAVATAVANIKKSAEGDDDTKDDDKPVTKEAVQDIVAKAVKDAMEPVLKSAGIPTNLDDEETVEKSAEHHYMEGVFGV